MSTAELSETVSVGALRDMLEQGQPVTILDVRPEEEWVEWRISGSVHVDAYDALKAGEPHALEGVSLPDGRPVVTVCGVGKTSLTAAEQLQERGIEAASLEGGIRAWSLAWNTAEVVISDSQYTILQIRRTGKGCLSYLIAAQGRAVVVDAALDPQIYLDLAEEHGWTVTAVLDTHVHADHLSRGRLLAELAGASFYLPAQDRVSYDHHSLRHGDAISVGETQIEAVHTPGHTMESTCYLLDGRILFTGDTLFLSGVGRPDLEADAAAARERAHLLYSSLQRFLALQDDTIILPGHTGEPVPFDGQPVAATLADVRRNAALLGIPEEEFVETLLARIPPTPPNHGRIVQLNEDGRLPDGDPVDLEAGANRCAIQ